MLASILATAEAVSTEITQVAETKNPILPTVNEMFWAAVFFLLLWILMKFVLLPPITKVMDARDEKVRSDLQAAEAAESSRATKLAEYEAGLAGARSEALVLLEAARDEKVRSDLQAAEAAESARVSKLAEYEAGLAGARAEAGALLEAARSEGDAERRTKIAAAEADAASFKAEASTAVADAKARARTELTASITDIAVGAAEAVVQKPIDRAAQTALVEDYVNRSGSQN